MCDMEQLQNDIQRKTRENKNGIFCGNVFGGYISGRIALKSYMWTDNQN